MPGDVLVRLERTGDVPVGEQIYHQLRAAILAGRLRQHDLLPPAAAWRPTLAWPA